MPVNLLDVLSALDRSAQSRDQLAGTLRVQAEELDQLLHEAASKGWVVTQSAGYPDPSTTVAYLHLTGEGRDVLSQLRDPE